MTSTHPPLKRLSFAGGRQSWPTPTGHSDWPTAAGTRRSTPQMLRSAVTIQNAARWRAGQAA